MRESGICSEIDECLNEGIGVEIAVLFMASKEVCISKRQCK